MAGRPCNYTQELAETICGRLADGESLRGICRDEDMPPTSSVFNWLTKFPEFAQMYEAAREAQAEAHADEIIYIADTEQDHKRARLMIDARKWCASKMKPKKYGNFERHEHSGQVETVVKLDEESIERARARLSGLHD